MAASLPAQDGLEVGEALAQRHRGRYVGQVVE